MLNVEVGSRDLSRFVELVGFDRVVSVTKLAAATRTALGGARIWNVSSTAAGGGVAEMLRSLLTYARGLGFDVRWLVIEGPPEFFRVTKRIHNALHDQPGDGSPLGAEQAALYERVLAENFARIAPLLRPGDFVVCHDPQTAGLVPLLAPLGVHVAFRCHIGHEGPGRHVDHAWSFLRRYLEDVPFAVFTRAGYAPRWIPRPHAVTMPPNIDPFSVKNQWIEPFATAAILARAGIVAAPPGAGAPEYVDADGITRSVARAAEVIRTGAAPSPTIPLIVQVSRWDRMKDHVGVLQGFARLIELGGDAGSELVLAGPSRSGVADDPEGPEVLREVELAWRAAPEAVRRRVHLVQIPMLDPDENAAIVNALQRHARVIVQKSLREGFGLTVTEAMWKGRPVVASAVGGIQDQIRDGVDGLLVRDPTSPGETARALMRILASPALAARMGASAHARVRARYLSISALERWGRFLRRVLV